MAFPRQPLLFTETVPHKAYETVEGNLSMTKHSSRGLTSCARSFYILLQPLPKALHSDKQGGWYYMTDPENFDALRRYESNEVDRRTWLHVTSGTLWSTSSGTHQVVEI